MWGQGPYDPAHGLVGPRARAKEGICRGRMGKGRNAKGTAEDNPVLGTPRLQREEQHLVEGCSQKTPEGDTIRMGPTWGTVRNWFRVNTTLRIKYTRQRPNHVNEKRRLDKVVSIIATNKKQGGIADGTGTEVDTCLINKWRAKINQEGLYNVKVDAPRKGLGKKA